MKTVALLSLMYHLQMGAIYRESLQFNESISHFRRSVDLKPNNVVQMNNLAGMLARYRVSDVGYGGWLTISRNEEIDEALQLQRKLIDLGACFIYP